MKPAIVERVGARVFGVGNTNDADAAVVVAAAVEGKVEEFVEFRRDGRSPFQPPTSQMHCWFSLHPVPFGWELKLTRGKSGADGLPRSNTGATFWISVGC